MSFSEFMQWLRNFLSRDTQATPPTTSPPATPSTPTPPPVIPPVTETPAPVPTPTPPRSPVPTKLKAIRTTNDKVTLGKDIEFQLITEPTGQYENCKLDLSDTTGSQLISDINPTSGEFTVRFNKASKSANDIQNVVVTHPEGDLSKAITVSQMKLFWHNHPGRENVCDDTLFANQCAIRMSTALELSGVIIPVDRRILRRCTTEYRAFSDHNHGLVKGHVLAAQELANWIKSEPSTFGSREVVHSKEEILGRSGVIFFRDGWGTTDHIDVWDGESLVGGFPSYFETEFKELWFWDLY
ncbi:T6SS effector amidase Tae4 family protein [Leucothrix arctica]|nr:T6SS effector amidase Tae4 family protein [Leucothrix arctica]